MAYENRGGGGGFDSRRKSHGAMVASQKNINAIALALGSKKINPLPPIEQYQTYHSKQAISTMSGNFTVGA